MPSGLPEQRSHPFERDMSRFLYSVTLLLLLAGDVASAQGTEWTFFVRQFGTSEYKEVQATLQFEGRFARVWVDNADTGRSAVKNALPKLVRALDTMIAGTNMNIAPRDSTKGILQNDIEVFGEVPTIVTFDQKTDFLMTDVGTGILGYFSPHDQTRDDKSNQMNLLYINSRQGVSNLTQLLSTIAHEFQHLIHHNRYPRPQTTDRSHSFYNEGLSENANLVNGYFDRLNTGYLANTNVDLFTMRSDPPSAQDLDYQRAMTFVHYLREQFGEYFIDEFTGMRGEGLERITKTLEKIGVPGNGEEVLKAFAVANLLQIDSNPAFGYRLRLGSSTSPAAQANPRRATVHSTHSGTAFPASEPVTLQPHGVYYIQYTNPGPVRMRLTGSVDGRAMLIAVRNGRTEVTELLRETDYTLPLWAGGPYERMTVALVNAGNGNREVALEVQALTSSAETIADASGSVEVSVGVDADGAAATVSARLVGTAGARLDVVNLRGETLRSIAIDGGTGTHQARVDIGDLATGGYIVRVVQGASVASAPLVVTR